MSTVKYYAPKLVKGLTEAEDFALVVTDTPVSGSTGTVSSTALDANIDTTTITGGRNDVLLSVAHPLDIALTPEYVSLTPTSCSVALDGQVTGLTNGQECKVAVYTQLGVKAFSQIVANSIFVTTAVSSYVAGSLARHVTDAIAAMVLAKSPGSTVQNVLSSSSGGWTTPAHIRNSSVFTGALNLSSISAYTSSQGNDRFPVVLISPRHVITGHAGATPGQKVVFVSPGNIQVVRTVVSQTRLPNGAGTDYVALLDAAVGSEINLAKFLPSGWEAKLPAIASTSTLFPVLNKGWTAGDFIRVLGASGISIAASGNTPHLYLDAYPSGVLSTWSSNIIGGDSNGPVFIPVNSELVLLHCMNYSSGGANYSSATAAIQTAMDGLLGGYALQYANLGTFTTF